MTAHDTHQHAEADRRSQPATPELTLQDACDWLHREGLVPTERIEGVVEDGEVYDLTAWESRVKAEALRDAALVVNDQGDSWTLYDRAERIQRGEDL
ncbi:hypothetical protein GCM10009718_32950 [Isoptericola halotolerans]|uniref:Uncharacterized protein n=1 Tax=Isoptericola halotolerans TaxID=300560 RepID=A0ABX2A5T8_9MICO|nr:hypothetical protein [Isoptericola halotolerans]NOV98183.1 hypothetical protein [Isoptericola halotolerans]